MKTLKAVKVFNLTILFSSILILQSCSEDTITPVNLQSYSVKAWNYSDSHYFIDTVYKSSYLDYYDDENLNSQTIELSVNDQNLEVWVQTETTTVGYRQAGLHIDLPELPVSGKYNDTLKSVPNIEQGIRTFGIARKLNQSEYKFNKYAGYVSFKIAIPDNYFAGVAYKLDLSGKQFGTISTDTNSAPNDTLVLKMIKVQNLIPQNTIAWNLKLRNIYQLPVLGIKENEFVFRTSYFNNGINESKLPGIPTALITILGLDRYTNGRTGVSDNKFDFISSFTIDQENGWIIFPQLKPFYENLSHYNSNGFTIDSSYWYPQIYSQSKADAMQAPNADKYLLSGLFKFL